MADTGSCGRFQIIHVVITQLTRFTAFWGMFLMMFGNYTAPWKCERVMPYLNVTKPYPNDTHTNSSIVLTSQIFLQGNYSLYSKSDNSHFSGEPFYNDSCDESCSRFEFGKESSTIISEFELICDKAWVPRALITVFMLGILFGSYFGGQIGETFGRKWATYSGTAILTVFCGILVTSVSWQMYAIFIFFVGFGTGSIFATSVVYATEFLNSKWRGHFLAVPLWNIALLSFSLVILFLKNWKYVHIVMMCVGCVAFLGVFWVSESVRWLTVQGKHKKASRVIQRIARINGESTPLSEVMSPSLGGNTMIAEAIVTESKPTKKMTYLDLFRKKHVRWISIKLGVIWLVILMCYYAMGYGVSSLAGDFYINLLVGSLTDIPATLSVGLLSNYFGRKRAISFYLVISGTSCLACALCRLVLEENQVELASTILVFIAKAFAAASWCSTAVLSLELYPSSLRSVGYGYLTMTSRIGGMICPLLIPQNNAEFIVCYAVMGVTLLISLCVIFTLTETNKRVLEDTVDDQVVNNDDVMS